jgi:hypothetical protein
LTPEECLELFTKQLRKKKKLNTSILDNTALKSKLLEMFEELSGLDNWGNARDIITLEKKVFRKIVGSTAPSQADLVVDEETIIQHVDAMISERVHRSQNVMTHLRAANSSLPVASQNPPNVPPPTTTISQSAPTITAQTESPPPPPPEPAQTASNDNPPRDTGVSDETWAQLQRDKADTETRDQACQTLLNLQSRAISEFKSQTQTPPTSQDENNEDDESRRLLEAQRIQKELERRAKEEELRELERKRKEMEAQRKKEAEAQKKLRKMGVCCTGYHWVRQSGGWRCAGGSHWVSEGELGL